MKYTGDGEDVSPPIAWSGLPEGTKELVLICDDPDAPTPEPWVHWVIYKIPADAPGLPEGVGKDARAEGAGRGASGEELVAERADGGVSRAGMPPPGHGVHRYFFRLYALKGTLVIEPGKDKKALLEEMSGHVLGEGQLMGTYER